MIKIDHKLFHVQEQLEIHLTVVESTWCKVLEEKKWCQKRKALEWTRWEGVVRGRGSHSKRQVRVSAERQRDSQGRICFKQKKKERTGGTKEPSAWTTLNALPLSCPTCSSCLLQLLTFNWTSLWRGHYHRITNLNAFTEMLCKITWICHAHVCRGALTKHLQTYVAIQDIVFSQC